jgi:hypothetical protein
VTGKDGGDAPVEVPFGQGAVERAGEPASSADDDMFGGSEPCRVQGFFGEGVPRADGRHHPQRDQFFDLGLRVHVVDGSDLQIDPAVAEGRTGLPLLGSEPERDARCLVWEADDHHAYQLLIDALRETPFWDRYFEVVDILVGTENGYARTYHVDPVATIST